ncbi:MAG: STAS domain-containing protein [Acidobacteriota bacterium]
MNISKRKSGNITLLDLEGELLMGDTSIYFRETLDSLIKEGEKDIIINFKNLKAIDSTGLGELAKSYTTAKKNGGIVKLINISEKLMDLLFLTKLITVFEIFNDEEKAVRSF